MSEWIEWGGGECPVPDGAAFRIRLRHGHEWMPDGVDGLDWSHLDWDANQDIIAYRIIKESEA